MIDLRKLVYVMPCFAAAGLGLVAAPGCGGGDQSPPAHASAPAASSYEAADQALKHDVAWAAVAAARCSEAGTSEDCAAGANDVGRITTQGLRTRGLVSDVLAQLPIKPIICAIAKKYLGGSSNSGAGDAGAGPDADADASAPLAARPAFDIWGARAVVENGGAAEERADVHEVWDMERCQAAMFVHPTGGVTQLTGETGYRGPARGAAGGVLEAGSGTFVLDGPLAEPAHVRKVGSAFFADLADVPGPEKLPPVEGAFIAANRGSSTYVPWDTGTRALVALRTGKTPRLAGTDGARFVQYEPDAASATTCGAQMAVAMLNQTGDEGNFQSSAGAGALTAIATGVARSLGIDLAAWCGDAEAQLDGGDGITDGSVAASASCHAKDPGFCGALSCTPNGDGIVCCRSEPTGNEPCPTGSDAECGPGFVCSIKRKAVAEGEPTQVCTRREACR